MVTKYISLYMFTLWIEKGELKNLYIEFMINNSYYTMQSANVNWSGERSVQTKQSPKLKYGFQISHTNWNTDTIVNNPKNRLYLNIRWGAKLKFYEIW